MTQDVFQTVNNLKITNKTTDYNIITIYQIRILFIYSCSSQNMSDKKRRRGRRKKKFLMGVENQWLIEDNLMPTYAHLVDSYSEKVKNECKVEVIKVEDSQDVNVEGSSEVKQEYADDSSVFHSVDEDCTPNSNMVMTLLFLVIIKQRKLDGNKFCTISSGNMMCGGSLNTSITVADQCFWELQQ